MLNRPADETFSTILAMLHRRARRLVPNSDEAADLAQDTALKLWQKQCNGVAPDDPIAYAMTALRNRVRSHWRSHRPWQELQEDMAVTLPDATCRIVCAQLCAALERLPKRQCELMQLVASGETSPAVLARLTNLPLGTVMSRLARARATLRGNMGLKPSAPVKSLYATDCDP